jgi:hypothetical protein
MAINKLSKVGIFYRKVCMMATLEEINTMLQKERQEINILIQKELEPIRVSFDNIGKYSNSST